MLGLGVMRFRSSDHAPASDNKPTESGGFGTTGFDGGATPIADCGGYGAGCPAIMVNGGLQQAFM